MNHGFIIHIWPEPREIKNQKPALRGSIEHIASGEKHYFKSLSDLIVHITPYLNEMNVKQERAFQLLYWLKRKQLSSQKENRLTKKSHKKNSII